MATFTLTGRILRHDLFPNVGLTVFIVPNVSMPDPALDNVYVSGPGIQIDTDENGEFTVVLATVAGLYYTVRTKGDYLIPEVTFAAASAGSTLNLADITSVPASPIPSVDATQLRSEFQAADNILTTNVNLKLNRADIIPIIKPSDQTVNNSITRINDTALVKAVVANGVYLLEGFLLYQSSTVADMSIEFALPSGASMNWIADGPASTSTTGVVSVTRDALLGISNKILGGIGANAVALPQGIVTVGANAGNVQLKWAQNALEVSNTIMRAGSWLRLIKIN